MSSAKYVKDIRKAYPDCRIRIDVTDAGLRTHCIKISLLDPYSKPVRSFSYYGRGNVNTLKTKALRQLAEAIAPA